MVLPAREGGEHLLGLGRAVGLAQDLTIDIDDGIAANDGEAPLIGLLCPYGPGFAQGKLPDGIYGAGAGGDGFIAVAGLHGKAAGDDGEKLPAAGTGAGKDEFFHWGSPLVDCAGGKEGRALEGQSPRSRRELIQTVRFR